MPMKFRLEDPIDGDDAYNMQLSNDRIASIVGMAPVLASSRNEQIGEGSKIAWQGCMWYATICTVWPRPVVDSLRQKL